MFIVNMMRETITEGGENLHHTTVNLTTDEITEGGEDIGGPPEDHVTDVSDLIVTLPQHLLQCTESIGILRLRVERGQLVKRQWMRGEGL